MPRVHTVIASSQKELDDALRVRDQVFRQEMNLLRRDPFRIAREPNAFDTLETTIHVVAYSGPTPVGTVRLLLPNPEVARDNGTALGIDLERKLALSGVWRAGMLVAEATRLCVRREWRHSDAVLRMTCALYRESRAWGVTHWVGCTNVETDSAEDAAIAYQVARRRGLVSSTLRAAARAQVTRSAPMSAPLYTPTERARAGRGEYDGLHLPDTLSFLVRKLGARFIGEPVFDAEFRMYAIPLVIDLDAIPVRTAAHFAPASLGEAA